MTKLLRAAVILVALLLCVCAVAMAAKPKPKPKPKTTNHATLGTTQLKGEYADIGSTYTLGGGDYALNLTVKSVEYSVAPLTIGDYFYYPKAGEKFLVIHFNVHNPRPQEAFARYDSFTITAVDAENENREYIKDAGIEPKATDDKNTKPVSFSMTMKPAQKVDVFTAIAVPAKGEVPKLIFKSPDDRVLRYDLKGKVKPLAAPYADPEDKTGATAFSKVPAKIGDMYQIGEFGVKVDGISFRDKPMPDSEMGEGNHYLVLALTIKNIAPTKQFLRGDFFQLGIKDADGVTTQPMWDMYLASRDIAFSNDVEPGQEVRGRYIFEVPKDLDMKTLFITREENRTYEYDLSGVK